MAGIKARLDRLEQAVATATPSGIEVWTDDLDADTVRGPQGRTLSAAEFDAYKQRATAQIVHVTYADHWRGPGEPNIRLRWPEEMGWQTSDND